MRAPGAGGWTAIFTAVLTIVAVLQWLAYREANELNAANQRATINVSGPAFGQVPSPDGKSTEGWMFQYGWNNSGRLPAKRVASQITFSLGDQRPVEGLNFATLGTGKTIQSVIGPSGGFQPPQIEMSVSDLKDVAEGKKHLFFWGWAIYDDGIPGTPRRLTEFCNDVTSLQFSNPDMSSLSTRVEANWPPCPVHNCYDEQCNDYNEITKQYP